MSHKYGYQAVFAEEARRAYREEVRQASRPGFAGRMREEVQPPAPLDLQPYEWSRVVREDAHALVPRPVLASSGLRPTGPDRPDRRCPAGLLGPAPPCRLGRGRRHLPVGPGPGLAGGRPLHRNPGSSVVTDRVFSVVLALPEEILGAVITEATERGGTVLRVSVLSEGPEELAVGSPPEPEPPVEEEPELVRVRRRLNVDHRASPLGRRRGIVRPTSETACGLVVLRELMVRPRTTTELEVAMVECSYSAESVSPTVSRLVREGVVERSGELVSLTDSGELTVLSDAFGERLVAMGLEARA